MLKILKIEMDYKEVIDLVNTSAGDMLNSIVPISRFNKGEANKIFEEVNEVGCKVVAKNNKPCTILISIEKYNEMMEQIEDFHFYLEAERRMKKATYDKWISQEDLMVEFGITKEDLDSIGDVEIE